MIVVFQESLYLAYVYESCIKIKYKISKNFTKVVKTVLETHWERDLVKDNVSPQQILILKRNSSSSSMKSIGEISKIFGELFFSIDPGYRVVKKDVST